jgi:hypothetical protein
VTADGLLGSQGLTLATALLGRPAWWWGERHGSFLPPPVAVRSRGSPNFLQLGDS